MAGPFAVLSTVEKGYKYYKYGTAAYVFLKELRNSDLKMEIDWHDNSNTIVIILKERNWLGNILNNQFPPPPWGMKINKEPNKFKVIEIVCDDRGVYKELSKAMLGYFHYGKYVRQHQVIDFLQKYFKHCHDPERSSIRLKCIDTHSVPQYDITENPIDLPNCEWADWKLTYYVG